MATQYSASFSNPTADMREIVANNVGMLNKYILFQTGEYEYTALIKNIPLNKVEVIRFVRLGSGYSYMWQTQHSTTDKFEYNISNEMYVYSNVGIGKSLDLPIYKGMTAFSLCIIVSVLSLAILFKGVLFKWLRKA